MRLLLKNHQPTHGKKANDKKVKCFMLKMFIQAQENVTNLIKDSLQELQWSVSKCLKFPWQTNFNQRWQTYLNQPFVLRRFYGFQERKQLLPDINGTQSCQYSWNIQPPILSFTFPFAWICCHCWPSFHTFTYAEEKGRRENGQHFLSFRRYREKSNRESPRSKITNRGRSDLP